jgi:hypothetical protein
MLGDLKEDGSSRRLILDNTEERINSEYEDATAMKAQ